MREPSREHLEWIKNLKVGDSVDAIKIDQHYRKVCWSPATVIQVLESHIRVQFVYEKDGYSRFYSCI